MSFKSIFLTGGVVSSLGKGLTAASLALLLERQGLKVAMLKLDPYLNVDPGTMNPYEHGEVYVTDDGVETDLDLGHYHRFSSVQLSKHSTATSGQIYTRVITKERNGEFLGSTVQVIPHVTNEIINVIQACAEHHKPDVLIIEIGGTIGDIESLPFLEAVRQFRCEHPQDCLSIHMTYVPYLKSAKEIKTKPTQHSVQNLRSIGISPDVILCRSEVSLSSEVKRKISLFCNVPENAVFNAIDLENSIYEMPLLLARENIVDFLLSKFGFSPKSLDLTDWQNLVTTLCDGNRHLVRIGLVGKYLEHKDAYKSVFESLSHASIPANCSLEIVPISPESEALTNQLSQCDGCLIPGGFGTRSWEGKIAAARYCRDNNIPCFGICLGMQALVVEYARYALSLPLANSLEMDPNTPDPVVCMMQGQDTMIKGGTMRLGAYPCQITPKSLAFEAYKTDLVQERHRHRYEVNPAYVDLLQKNGLRIVGVCPQGDLCEIIEIPNHRWMLGVQFHPEFLSKLAAPHPLFVKFLSAALDYSLEKGRE
ncbi:CTP synthetase [Chlamydia muridarum str. Nigg]|jgi:CTP synthase|uniref:CTP synthase n=2 Tax=Chlamydia muridarum TaxID=83560 RepID=PYRG_CHLMU|nr:CTP synthase [Chlamydia muridarum]Q9PKL0.1 RecName: Full=CTP synthase; AltName: Full=Cytidine 5'-triphosphate synthase; AltName: Full=Cytidine triphosphate synthetase; Short=CTP synthetase; Short=CTPS; AltName: Full=UTP--ammonia ligase [Chlamydia muridarum str. Nigg]UFT31934.1 CTP synthase [Chlamydia trachomatis]AAF39308.1 CTP synthase [Chlamydia muridarum str. Nigg]AHH22840.1 CTP synthetase [Chlamydia muridarum str. Nigg3 CMUT3-5]AHH23765.1 CTP synthetase [Chlamydia muridarum str. Nigg CM9